MRVLNFGECLLAAQGYFELGLYDEAEAELELLGAVPEISATLSKIRLAIYAYQERWHDADLCACDLRELEPNVLDHFLVGAHIRRNLNLIGSAFEILLEGPPGLEELPEYHYQLACYYALEREPYPAYLSLQRAAELNPAYWEAARHEPDLAALRHRLPPPSPETPKEQLLDFPRLSPLPSEPGPCQFN